MLAFLAVLATAGCRRSVPGYFGTVTPKHGPDEVWVNNGGEPEYIDPGKCSDSSGSTVIFNTFSGLTQPHPKTLEPMPDVARRWDVSPDGRTYTFYLRPSKWSDGRPLTAHDFVYSWTRVMDPRTASKYITFFTAVENASAFSDKALWLTGVAAGTSAEALTAAAGVEVARVKLEAERGWAFVWVKRESDRSRAQAALAKLAQAVKVTDASVVGVRAIDDLTFEVRLEHPVPYFLSLVMYYTAMPVPRHVIEGLRARGVNTDLWTRPENFVSNGPFIVREWKFRRYIELEKNPRYWEASTVRIKRVRIASVEDENTTMNFYRSGEIDYIGTNSQVPPEFVDHLSKFRDFSNGPYLAVYYYMINVGVPGLDDKRVRQALNLAIDREQIVRYVLRAGQIASTSLVPPGLAGYENPKPNGFDPAKARALLREAGYGPGGKTLPRFTLIYNTLETHKLVAQAVQQMWKQHLGVQIDLENQEWKVYLKNRTARNFQIARAAWVGDYPDPFTFLDLLTEKSGNNNTGWSHPEYERLVAEANRTLDAKGRLALLRQAEELMLAEAPVLPIYIYTRPELRKPYLRGFWGNVQNRPRMKYWYIDTRFYDGVPDVRPEDPPPPILQPEPPP